MIISTNREKYLTKFNSHSKQRQKKNPQQIRNIGNFLNFIINLYEENLKNNITLNEKT